MQCFDEHFFPASHFEVVEQDALKSQDLLHSRLVLLIFAFRRSRTKTKSERIFLFTSSWQTRVGLGACSNLLGIFLSVFGRGIWSSSSSGLAIVFSHMTSKSWEPILSNVSQSTFADMCLRLFRDLTNSSQGRKIARLRETLKASRNFTSSSSTLGTSLVYWKLSSRMASRVLAQS